MKTSAPRGAGVVTWGNDVYLNVDVVVLCVYLYVDVVCFVCKFWQGLFHFWSFLGWLVWRFRGVALHCLLWCCVL